MKGLGCECVFLLQAIEPPKEESVAAAVESLREVGALDEKEELTPLGHHLAALPVDARVGKVGYQEWTFQPLQNLSNIGTSVHTSNEDML
jgi:ATP-dependent RNA helicase DHX36